MLRAHEAPNRSQPQTGAGAVADLAAALSWLEDAIVLSERDADAPVPHRDHRPRSVLLR